MEECRDRSDISNAVSHWVDDDTILCINDKLLAWTTHCYPAIVKRPLVKLLLKCPVTSREELAIATLVLRASYLYLHVHRKKTVLINRKIA